MFEKFLFRSSRGVRRHAQDELTLRDRFASHTGFDPKLHQVVHVRQFFGMKVDRFLRPDRAQKLHHPDRGEKKERPGIFRKTGCGGDPRRLGKRFGKDYARHQRVSRKVSREHCIVGVERRPRLDGAARFASDYLTDKNEGRPMRQTQKVISDK